MKLDKNRIIELLMAADTRWYNRRSDHTHQYNYREHLEFIADHIVKNYDRQSKHIPGGNHNHIKPKKVQAQRLL